MLKRWLPLTLIVAGLGLLIVSAAIWRLSASPGHVSPALLPAALAGLPLRSWTDGPQAIAEIGRMHTEGFPLKSAAIGRYGTSDQVMLWVSEMANAAAARQMAEAMSRSIAEVSSPFRETGQQSRVASLIHELEGMGQKHFFYPSGLHVVWLGADPAFAEQALRNTLEMYP